MAYGEGPYGDSSTPMFVGNMNLGSAVGGAPGMMGWVPRGMLPGRMEGIDFGRIPTGAMDVSFVDTRLIIKERLKEKYSFLPNIALNVMSFGQALYKHPFRKTIANAKYNPTKTMEYDKTLRKYY